MPRLFLSYDTDAPNAWRLEQAIERKTSIGLVVVPQGFETDLASTPNTVWRRFPRWGRWSGAAIVHDFFYRTHPPGVTRFRADKIFEKLMREDGVYFGDVDKIFRAVRAYGGRAWNQKKAP